MEYVTLSNGIKMPILRNWTQEKVRFSHIPTLIWLNGL